MVYGGRLLGDNPAHWNVFCRPREWCLSYCESLTIYLVFIG